MKSSIKTFITTSIFILVILTILIFSIFKLIDFNQENSSQQSFRVIDGDTFILNNETIRLLCVQTPEKGKEGYQQSSSYLSSLLSQGQIILKQQDKIDKDMYNRSLRLVYIQTDNSSLFVNKLIITNSFGTLFPFNNTNCSLLE